MGKRRHIYTLGHAVSAVVMLLALVWLTVCLPCVNKAQQVQKQLSQQQGKVQTDNSNPLSNTTEEKNESGVSLLQEYLHEVPELSQNFITLTTTFKRHPSDLYLAYHPELLIPPPEA